MSNKKLKPCEKCGEPDYLKLESGLELCTDCYEIELKKEYDVG